MRTRKKIQTLIFDKSKFKCTAEVKQWLKKHKFKMLKKKMYASKHQYRVMQRSTNKFKKSTFKKVKLAKCVYAVKGVLK